MVKTCLLLSIFFETNTPMSYLPESMDAQNCLYKTHPFLSLYFSINSLISTSSTGALERRRPARNLLKEEGGEEDKH